MPFPPATCCQSQIVCSGCKNLLIYPAGATSICCALCHAVSPVPTSGIAMARLVCRGCHTLLMYSRGATSVQCSCCRTVNSASKANQTAHINCGNCRVLLMYQCGAHSVKCTLCNFVTSVGWDSKKRIMQSAMEKLSNMGIVAKEKLKICRAKLHEKVEKATVKTAEERRIAEERRKATEAEAKRELHEAKARRAARKLRTRKSHVHGGHLHHHAPVEGGAATHLGGANVPAYPIASQGYHPGHKI